MITAVAFVPSAPVLVPAVASGAAVELDHLRAACLEALREVCDGVQRVVLIGAGSRTAEHSAALGSFRGFGVSLDVPLDPAHPVATPQLPLSLTIGAWLLAQVGWPGDRLALEVDPGADDEELDQLGTSLALDPARSALVVVADGSAARSERAPASSHPDAEAFDSEVVAALASGDPSRLAEIDRDRARVVSAAGRPAWLVAAAATARTGLPAYDARLLADSAPYGVGYAVATWRA